MPPKESRARREKHDDQGKSNEKHDKQQNETQRCERLGDSGSEESAGIGAKRKAHSSSSSPQLGIPAKAMKLGSSSPHEAEIIRFLLSTRALELCENPKTDPPSSDGKTEKDYFTPTLTPFEHLLCAIILSRPISHVLGQRTIKTVLNEPWNFSDPKNILKAGKENADGKTQRVEAMEKAKTQHRQKTAAQLGGLAQVVVDEKWDEENDGSLKGLLKVTSGKESELRKVLKGKIKGMGDTGVDIFLRRVQGCKGWERIGWFVDGKTGDALKELGLPTNGEEIKKLVEEIGEADVRMNYVLVLERALGIILEGKQKEINI